MTADRSALLSHVTLFSQCAPQELDALAQLLQPRRYERGEAVFHQGDDGTAMYLIEEGGVTVALTSSEDKEVILALLGPGDFFGELALLDGEPRSATVRAREPARLLALRRDDFQDFLRGHPHVAPLLLAALSRRLRRADQTLQDVAFLDVPARLARVLIDLAEREGEAGPDGVVISPRLTQSDLAGMVGATRESVNKWLRAYARRGLVSHQQGRLIVKDLRALRREVS